MSLFSTREDVCIFLSTNASGNKLDLGSDKVDSVGFKWIVANLLKYIAKNRLHFNDKQVQEIWRDYAKPSEQLAIDLSTNDKQLRFCDALNRI